MSEPTPVGRVLRIPSTGQVIRIRAVATEPIPLTAAQRTQLARILHDELTDAGAPLVVWQDTSVTWQQAAERAAETIYQLGRVGL